jgi:LysR family transcriptional activator of nhaA
MGSEMMEVLQDRLKPEKFHVQLGALDSIPKHLIARMVESAYAIAPCSVSVLEGDDGLLVRELLAHRIDLILTNHPPVADGKKIFVKSLGKLKVVVCGASKFKSVKKEFPRSLDGMPFVMPTRHSKLRQDLDHYFETHHIRVDISAETQDTSLQNMLGSKGLGLLPVSAIGAQSLLKGGGLIELGVLEGITEEIFLVSASRKIENPVSSKLLKTFSI